jgi:caa(3)-type oxidase subunit IV
MEPQIHKHHHHILPTKVACTIGAALIFLTGVTVWIAHVDLGPLNFVIAMAVASVKALLVALFFMNLFYDRAENGLIFLTSFLFLAIFVVLTATDLFFRGDVYVKGPLFAAVQAKSTLKKPWISTPQLVARGKELYAVQCVSCHGADGKGDGPAASALNPHPRNFHETAGWKNGRKPTMVFKTLKEGLPPSAMASYATLPSDDRWALAHYVLSLGPKPEADTSQDFANMKIDPNQEGGGAQEEEKSIPVEIAMERAVVPEVPSEAHARMYYPGMFPTATAMMEGETRIAVPTGKQIYLSQCVQCHGLHGEGGIKVKAIGANPVAYLTTLPFTAQSEEIKSEAGFKKRVQQGLPGQAMPAFGELSDAQLNGLYRYVSELVKSGSGMTAQK